MSIGDKRSYLHTSMSCRALAVLDSTRTCLTIAVFTESESIVARVLVEGELAL